MDLQSEIRKIQRNTELSGSEKSKQVAELMRSWNKSKADAQKGAEAKKTTEKPKPTAANCKHYVRGCDMQCPTCEDWFPCRLCHDEYADHKLDRHKVNKVKCRKCSCVQPPHHHCQRCSHQFGAYYCAVCHLWTDGHSPIFHCTDCGICRVGLKKDYTHCQKCNHCYSNNFYATHKCVEDSTKMPCPVCNEYMFDGTKENNVAVLKCGHSIHVKCWEELLKHGNYRCPFCKKTANDGIKAQWRTFDMLAPFEPIPEEFEKKRLIILCNDCGEKSDIAFSFEFRKCKKCSSYNTNEIDVYEAEGGSSDDSTGDNEVSQTTIQIPPPGANLSGFAAPTGEVDPPGPNTTGPNVARPNPPAVTASSNAFLQSIMSRLAVPPPTPQPRGGPSRLGSIPMGIGTGTRRASSAPAGIGIPILTTRGPAFLQPSYPPRGPPGPNRPR